MKIKTKQYIDNQFAWQKQVIDKIELHFESEISSMRRATDKYSETTDEWKTLHNGLQRQLSDQGKEFITKDQFKDFIRMIWAVVALLAILIATAYFKK
jgi:hypothetical protein